MNDFGDKLMKEAKLLVAARSSSFKHKMTVKVWYKGRKQIQGLPKKAFQKTIGLIPVPMVGAAVNLAFDQAINKVHSKRQKSKTEKYKNMAANESKESLRKYAKFSAKNLKDLADKIDSNQVKLKDASTKFNATFNKYKQSHQVSAPTQEEIWKVGMALYERERYEDKVGVLIETTRTLLNDIEIYLDKCRSETADFEKVFAEDLNAMEPLIRQATEDSTRGKDGYGRLI
ncbi:MAG: hypothetical protein GQ582_07410 [Methyloprofundus sp.]|nr:hypothetical protein [Methyloprofundus sp.]